MSTVHWIVAGYVAVSAVIGTAWTVARVFDGIERAWNWLRRDRVGPLLEDDPMQGPHEDDCWCHECKPLPPERTWEQMTSHQLPVWWRETAAQIVDAQRWWYELPSGTGFTRAMAARVREMAP